MKTVINCIGLVLIAFVSFQSLSKEKTSFECKEINNFISYKDAKKLEKEGDLFQAIHHYCNLAHLGDYRAQFKMSNFYFTGIPNLLEKSLVNSYLWAEISNSVISTKKKSQFISTLKSKFNDESLVEAKQMLKVVSIAVPSGLKYDMEYKPLDFNKINKQLNKKKLYTGSRIKRNRPPSILKVVQ